MGIRRSLSILAPFIVRIPSVRFTSFTCSFRASETRNPHPYSILKITGRQFCMFLLSSQNLVLSAAANNAIICSCVKIYGTKEAVHIPRCSGKNIPHSQECTGIHQTASHMSVCGHGFCLSPLLGELSNPLRVFCDTDFRQIIIVAESAKRDITFSSD